MLRCEAGEIAQIDEVRGQCVGLRELPKSLIECEEVCVRFGGSDLRLGEGNADAVAASLVGGFASGLPRVIQPPSACAT